MFEKLVIEILGESHGGSVGVRLSGVPSGESIDLKELQSFTDRRKSSANPFSTPRKEEDLIEIVSGIENGLTVGTISAEVANKNVRSGDYAEILSVPRPSHADYASFLKYGKIFPGGGRFSGRMTLPLCIAGGIAKQILARRGIQVAAYVSAIGKAQGFSYRDLPLPDHSTLSSSKGGLPSFIGQDKLDALIGEMRGAQADGDSVGGVIECAAFGMPPAGGELFQGLEGKISYAVFAVPAVKGIEFGHGFRLSQMRGSEANDYMRMEDGKPVFLSNRSGGILGGIADGAPITLRVAVKPTPSISKTQRSVDLVAAADSDISVIGRHDCCIVPRAAVCIEAAVALALLDACLSDGLI